MPQLKGPPDPSEHDEQVSFFRWLAMLMTGDPDVGLAFAIPNGGHRHIKTARYLKAEGVKPGVPDICWPVPRWPYHGLYIEMKRVRGGNVSREQKRWIERLRANGYQVCVCKGLDAAKAAFSTYQQNPTWVGRMGG